MSFADNVYSKFVEEKAKPGQDIIDSMDPGKAHLLHMAVGISGEAGELLDAVKKHVVYNKPLDRENVIEELGDLEFYMQGVRNGLGLTREQVLEHNMQKLNARYKAGYSDKAAQERADKQPQVTLMSCMMCDTVTNQTPDGICTACKKEAA